jgi:hypothetical protein
MRMCPPLVASCPLIGRSAAALLPLMHALVTATSSMTLSNIISHPRIGGRRLVFCTASNGVGLESSIIIEKRSPPSVLREATSPYHCPHHAHNFHLWFPEHSQHPFRRAMSRDHGHGGSPSTATRSTSRLGSLRSRVTTSPSAWKWRWHSTKTSPTVRGGTTSTFPTAGSPTIGGCPSRRSHGWDVSGARRLLVGWPFCICISSRT